MKPFILAALLLLSGSLSPCAIAQAQPAPLPTPIAPASAGQMQCYLPDTRRKTCDSLASYRRGPNGEIENITVMLVSSAPVVTMEVSEPVEIKAGQICGVMLRSQLDAAKFDVKDKPLDKTQIEKLRERVGSVMQKYFGHEMCSAIEDLGLNLVAKQSMDGTPLNLVVPHIWVRPEDGYEVRP
jgi:hypothetical protein